MRTKLLLLILAAVFLGGCSLPSFIKPKYAAVQITTKPEAEVFLDGEKLGETGDKPFKTEKLEAKEYTLRLAPKRAGLQSWETKVTFRANITTVISHEFGEDAQSSTSEIIALEKLADKKAVELVAISTPDNASLKLDNQPKGFTPLQLKNVTAGEHVVILQAPGYRERRIEVKTIEGHKLTLEARLAKEPAPEEGEATPSAQPEEEVIPTATPTPTRAPTPTKTASPSATLERPYVEILDTPTGWLRVRSTPTTSEDNELTTVKPGETYPYLESNDTGWHKIRLPDGQEGWISGRYATVYR